MLLAHAVGAPDLPVPLGVLTFGVVGLVLVAFAAGLELKLPTPLTERHWPDGVLLGGRILGAATLAFVVSVALFGLDNGAANLAPVAAFVLFWAGMTVLVAVIGDVWPVVSPFAMIPARTGAEGRSRTAALLLLAFVWFELAYHAPRTPRALGTFLVLYVGVVVVLTLRRGRAWQPHGEGLTALFGLVGGRTPWPGAHAVLIVPLAAVLFDGMTGEQWWSDLVGSRQGWSATGIRTLALVVVVFAVAIGWRLAAGGQVDAAVPTLVPLLAGATAAHYLTLLLFESQTVIALASDPWGQGWDLFGTADRVVDYQALSSRTLDWIQIVLIAAGTVLAVGVARSVGPARRLPRLTAFVGIVGVASMAWLLGT